MKYLLVAAFAFVCTLPNAPAPEGARYIAPVQAGDVVLPVCSTAVHDLYRAPGPDGVLYPTWHPQIDTVHGCRFDHEHASSPGLLAPVDHRYRAPSIVPFYGYVATKHGMSEPHAGFKSYVLANTDGYRWMITQHFGTANALGAACARFHTVDIVGVNAATLEKVADIHFMGDFGTSLQAGSNVPLAPLACPNQAQDAAASFGRRFIPVETFLPDTYETWRLDRRPLAALGFSSGDMTFKTAEPITICNAVACSAAVPGRAPSGPPRGTWHYLYMGGGFSVTGVVSGTFYTDPMGQMSRQSGDADAVQQYIKPGFSYQLPTTATNCFPDGFNEQLYWCTHVIIDDQQFRRDLLITGAN